MIAARTHIVVQERPMSIELLVPVSLFFSFTALYLGGMAVEVVGGTGPRQILSLIVMFVIYMAVWFGLHKVLGGTNASLILGVIVPTIVTSLALPLIARAAFMALGMKIQRTHVAAH
jgi:hypothetical protein